MGVGEAADAALVSQGFVDCRTERQGTVFRRVMIVDIQVALGVKRHIHAAVSCQGVQEVIEKSETGDDIALAGAVKIDGDRHGGLSG